ncbi:MAG: hypothetical protein DMG06_14600 [Acidobacteria bacterium]|nr:MAG: hypothetical protein DMG06_14600 [Acidobacteriota bacterium]
MIDALKTVVILSDERHKKEYRHVLGKVDEARIELEILNLENSLSDEWIDEVSHVQARLFLVDLPREPENALGIMEQIHQQFPQLPILAAGDSYNPAFLMAAMRLGVKEFLPKPLSAEKLKEAYQRLDKLIFDPGVENSPANIFSFFSSKGGTGTTAIATNFAVSLRMHSKKKILLLDLHSGDAADFLGVRNNIYLFEGNLDLPVIDRQFISKAIVSHQKSGIDILSLTNRLWGKSGSVAAEIRQVLNVLQRDYDYICVDASSKLDENAAATLETSHLIFLISQSNVPALRNAQRLLLALEGRGYSESRVRLLINRYSGNEEIGLKEIEKFVGLKVFWTIPNNFNSLMQSIRLGEPLAQQTLSIPLAKTFYELSGKVLGIQSQRQLKPSRGSILGLEKDAPARSLSLTI